MKNGGIFMHGHWLNDLFYNFDDSIFKATYNLEQNIPWLAKFAKFISWFGNSPAPLLLLLAVVLCVFRKTRKKNKLFLCFFIKFIH